MSSELLATEWDSLRSGAVWFNETRPKPLEALNPEGAGGRFRATFKSGESSRKNSRTGIREYGIHHTDFLLSGTESGDLPKERSKNYLADLRGRSV